MLICPYCAAALVHESGVYHCANGHAFDRAREGYVNLLQTRNTGDSGEMLRARRAFLEHGHYAPLAEAVCRVVSAHLSGWSDGTSSENAAAVLDSGCGEGYYLGRLRANLRPAPQYRLWGLDSSRDAVRMAAARYRECDFVVADCKDALPFATGTIAAITCIFAPRNAAEFARVLAPGGLLLIAIPGPDHLSELRQQLPMLGMEEDKLQHVSAQLAADFTSPDVQTLRRTLDLAAEEVALLVTMSPTFRHQPERALARLQPGSHYRTSVEFITVACTRGEADSAP